MKEQQTISGRPKYPAKAKKGDVRYIPPSPRTSRGKVQAVKDVPKEVNRAKGRVDLKGNGPLEPQ